MTIQTSIEPRSRKTTPQHTPPRALASVDRWLNWRKGRITDTETGKFDKIPFDGRTGQPINDKDPSSWRTLAACQGRGLLGFALGDGFAGIDLDRCRNPQTGVIAPWALDIISAANSYTEVSPSGTGVKIWVRGKLSHMLKARIGDAGGSIEVYSEKRFFTFTGHHLSGTPTEVHDAQPLLDDLARTYAPPVRERPKRAERAPVAVSGDLTQLRQRGFELAAQIRAGRLDPVTFTALRHELYKVINPAIEAAVPATFNAAYTVGNVLEKHGAVHISTFGDTDYYSGITGDTHTHTVTLKVKDGRVWSLSPNSRLWNDTDGHDAFSAYTVLEHNGKTQAAQAAAADLLAPVTVTPAPTASTPEPQAPAGPTPEQRRAWADAKRQQRQRQQEQAAAVQSAIMERINADATLSDIAQTVAMVLIDVAGKRDWCRPSVATIARIIDDRPGKTPSERHVRRGLEELERKGYIRTERKVNPETGEIWSGGKSLDTPVRTFVDYTSQGIATPQSADIGLTTDADETEEKTADVSHVYKVTCITPLESNQQAAPILPPDEAPEPIAFAGGASFDPAAVVPVPEHYRGRTKRLGWSLDDCNSALQDLHADYRRTHPQPEPTDQPAEAEQQPLAEVQTRKPKRRRARQSQTNDPRQIERDIAILQRAVAKVAKSNPRQAHALRRQVEEKQRALVDLAERGDAEMDALDRPATLEAVDDGGGLSVTFASPARELHTDTRAEPVYDAVGMIARLMARKEAVHAT